MKKLYILLLIVVVGFVGNAQVVYESPICINSASTVMPIWAPNTPMGGTFTSSVGIVIDPATGIINLMASVPGAYVINYSVPASPPDNPAMSYTCVVVLTPVMTPNFTPPTSPICSGDPIPVMPNVSNDGISGLWTVTDTSVDNLTIYTYNFFPNSDQCAEFITITVVAVSPYVPVVTSATGSDTVYVDENNEVVAPLELLSEMPLGYSYQWYVDTELIPDATGANYTVNTAAPTDNPRSYRIYATDNESGCQTLSSQFMVYQSSGTPPPFADRFQTLPPGSTLADITISGTGIRWYASASDKNALVAELPLSTTLVDGATYYASQTVNGSESIERYPVTVQLVLGIDGNELASVSFYPNPVKHSLTIKALSTIDSIAVMNVLGQTLKTTPHHQTEVVEIMSEFSAGTYFIRVSSGSRTQVIKIIKQ